MNTFFSPSLTNHRFSARELLYPLGLFLALSVLVVLPFFWLGTASGHDFEFHAPNWLDVAYQWKQGVVYPRWTAWTNHGFGEPRFIFYPPLSWLLGAALTLVLPGVAVPIVFIVLVQTFAGCSAYLLLRHLAARGAAVLGAAFYVVNPNALLLSYIRSDFAEQLACAFLPLLFLATLRLGEKPRDSTSQASSLASFSLWFAAVWLSNAPAAVISSYAVTFLIAWTAISDRSMTVAVRGLAGLLLGFGLAAFYIVPAAYEQRWVNIGQALASGLLPSENFLFTWIPDAEHTWFNCIASMCTLSLIVLLALTALASRRFSSGDPEVRRAALPLLALGAAATFLTLHWSWPLWGLLPKLRFVQFPWRWISVLAVLGSCFLAFTVERRRGWMVFAVALLLSVPLARFLTVNTWWDPDEMATQRDGIDSGQGFDGTDEYDPSGDDHLDLPLDAPLAKPLPADSADPRVPKVETRIDRWTTEEKLVHVDAEARARIALRVLNYPAWRVFLNGQPVQPERLDDVNQMVVPVPSGASEIRVVFARTLDRQIGDSVSLSSAALLLFLFWRGRKHA